MRRSNIAVAFISALILSACGQAPSTSAAAPSVASASTAVSSDSLSTEKTSYALPIGSTAFIDIIGGVAPFTAVATSGDLTVGIAVNSAEINVWSTAVAPDAVVVTVTDANGDQTTVTVLWE